MQLSKCIYRRQLELSFRQLSWGEIHRKERKRTELNLTHNRFATLPLGKGTKRLKVTKIGRERAPAVRASAHRVYWMLQRPAGVKHRSTALDAVCGNNALGHCAINKRSFRKKASRRAALILTGEVRAERRTGEQMHEKCPGLSSLTEWSLVGNGLQMNRLIV